jgi:hypothetical protein
VNGEIELTYCVVNTSQRELLVRGLDAIGRERASELPFATEVLVLDNGSRDGSAQAARAHPAVDETIAVCAAAERGLRAAARYDARAVPGAPGAPGCGMRGGTVAAP